MSITSLTSTSLPPAFFESALWGRAKPLSQGVETRFLYLRTATLSLQRVIAIGGGVFWILFLTYGFPEIISIGSWPSVFARSFLLLEAFCVLLIGIFKIHGLYRLAMAVASISYFSLLLIHSIFIFSTGSSPLSDAKLGDYSGIPAAWLVASIPGTWMLALTLIGVSLAAALNLGTTDPLRLLVEATHGIASVILFVIVLPRGIRTAEEIDKAASRTYRDATILASQTALVQLETRFMAFIHDSVLSQLNAIWLQTAPTTNAQLNTVIHATKNYLDTETAQIPMPDAARRISKIVLAECPNAIIRQANLEGTLSAVVVAALSDAMQQAAINIRLHAPESTVQLSFECANDSTSFTVTLTDTGPGFDLNGLSEDRAGIKVSILARLRQTPGCDGQIFSNPSSGTTVIARWQTVPVDSGISDPVATMPSVYESMGFDSIYRPIPAILAWLIFLGLSLTSPHPFPLLWALSLVSAACALAAIIQRPTELLPAPLAYGAACAIWLFFTLATAENAPDQTVWPFAWAPWAALLMCVFLAMRNRPLAGWAAWISCMLTGQFFYSLGFHSDFIALSSSWTHLMVLLPASVMPWMVKRISDGLPLLLSSRRDQAISEAVAATQQRYFTDASDWLQDKVNTAFLQTRSESEKRTAGHLLEMRLRDSIRSPLFDSPSINAATWDARLRGVTVRLLDDRSERVEFSSMIAPPPALPQLHRILENKLHGAQPGDTVVARLLPEGRTYSGTVLLRTSESDQVAVERV